jgi:hypothetical protein
MRVMLKAGVKLGLRRAIKILDIRSVHNALCLRCFNQSDQLNLSF